MYQFHCVHSSGAGTQLGLGGLITIITQSHYVPVPLCPFQWGRDTARTGIQQANLSPHVYQTHWVPVHHVPDPCVILNPINFFDGTLPPCLSSCHSVYTPSHTLHSSSDEKTLSHARWKLKGFGHSLFSVQAPLVWNNLPPHIRHSSSLSQFKTSLKTFLITSAVPELP